MSKRRRVFPRVLLLLLVAFALAAAFWFGRVPPAWSPFATITLSERPGIFVDPRLAMLRRNPALCDAVLKPPHISAARIADNPLREGCGWVNSVSVRSAGGAEVGADKLTCEMAAALALWIEYEVQPLAQKMFGARVASLQDYGTYSCRNIVGNVFWKDFRSQHATANAYDVGGFTLSDGRTISVARNWRKPEAESRFLREAHRRACRYFRVALGPDFNPAHRDHLHLDRGPLWTCR